MEVDAKDKGGKTPLLYAASSRSLSAETAELLIKAGADINACDRDYKKSVLYYAVGVGNEDLVKLLLEKECKVDVADKNGQTPLRHAVSHNKQEILR